MDFPKDPIEFWTALAGVGSFLAAIGTIAAFAIAFYQIFAEQRRRRSDERRAQAQRISGWIGRDPVGPPATRVVLLNTSDEPVYSVIAWLVVVQGGNPRTSEEAARNNDPSARALITVLPPGRYGVDLDSNWSGMHWQAGIEIAFSDARGQHWIRRASGGLVPIAVGPVKYYGLPQPVSWRQATPVSG